MAGNAGNRLKRLPQVDAVFLDEEGRERASKRASFEVEVDDGHLARDRKTQSLVDLFNWPTRALEDLCMANPDGYDTLATILFHSSLEVKSFYSG